MAEYLWVEPRPTAPVGDREPFYVELANGTSCDIAGWLVDGRGHRLEQITLERDHAKRVCRAVMSDRYGLVPV